MGYLNMTPSEDHLHHDTWTHNRDTPDKEKLARHLAEHVTYAVEANAALRDAELRAAANRASEVTDGRVYFLYSTQPATVTYYVFAPDGLRRNRKEALEYCLGVAAKPDMDLL